VPQKARILLVDDRAENLIALEAILSSLNQQLVPVRSGEEALKALLSDEFAVILLDVVMPGMDGFETAGHIKRRARTHDVPIIFLTAAGAEPDHAFRGYAAGAVDYIAKPFDPWVLRAKVAVFIDLYMKNRQLAEQAELLRRQAESTTGGTGGGLLAELSRRLSAVEGTAIRLAGLPVVNTDIALADGLAQMERGIGRLRDTLDALGAQLAPGGRPPGDPRMGGSRPSSPLGGGCQPAWVCSRTILAGTPAATQWSGTSPRTTEPAAITTLRPIRAPGSTITPAPSHDPEPIVTVRFTGTWRPIGVSGSA
jgi:CheY-like chemotaxis protein